MKVKPLQDRVLVKRLEQELKTKGGIIIPDTGKEKPAEGKVVAVGPGKKDPDGKAIEGLKYANEKPSSEIVPDQRTLPVFDPHHPKRYRWADVAEDPYTLMPRLTAADLAELIQVF